VAFAALGDMWRADTAVARSRGTNSRFGANRNLGGAPTAAVAKAPASTTIMSPGFGSRGDKRGALTITSTPAPTPTPALAPTPTPAPAPAPAPAPRSRWLGALRG
jgi:hypothetical protein